MDRIDFINAGMKSIKKVQNRCLLMFHCHSPKTYDAIPMEDGVYIPDLKMHTKLYNAEYPLPSEFKVKIIIIMNRESFKKVKVVRI